MYLKMNIRISEISGLKRRGAYLCGGVLTFELLFSISGRFKSMFDIVYI